MKVKTYVYDPVVGKHYNFNLSFKYLMYLVDKGGKFVIAEECKCNKKHAKMS